MLGAVGDECVTFTQEMERQLGKQEGERELKPEYEATEGEVEQDYEAGS